MKYLFYLGIITVSFLIYSCQSKVQDEKTDSLSAKVDSVLSLMTLDEKIGQLNQYSIGEESTGPGAENDYAKKRYEQLINGEVGSVLNLLGAENTRKLQKRIVEETRLGIPLLFSYDVIHGYKTIFPIPLAESASWNLEGMEKAARISAIEASAAGLHWTFAPMVDVSQDARWGRVMEGSGEDPYLGGMIAKARVRGLQGDDLSKNNSIAACAKHFAGYGFVQSGKDYDNVYFGQNTLLNTVLPPFKVAAENDVATFMNAFNDIDGVPSTSNTYLLRDVLKGEWAFDGVVVSDWNSIGELVPHGVANDNKEAAKLAINAGSDIDMEANAYIKHLKSLVEEGTVKEEKINDAVRRVLRLKFKLGLFEDPYKYSDVEREISLLSHPDHIEFAREIARESIVLLQNKGDLLPLSANKKVALIGPLAKDKDSPLGNWRAQGESNSAVSLYEGLVDALGSDRVQYAEGCKLSVGPNTFADEVVIEEKDRSGFKRAIALARSSDLVVMSLGETAYMSGEARSRSDIGLPGLQLDLLKEVYKVNKNIVLVLMNGRPLTLQWEADHVPAIVEAWHLGSQAGYAIADVLTGKYNPSGKLPMSFPRHVGQLPLYYNHKNTGRPSSDLVFYAHHMDVDNSPLFAFGHGLSYADFEYSDVKLSTEKLKPGEALKVEVQVSNTKGVDGEEVVQLYVQDMVASITRPVKELKGFKKVFIPMGKTETVSFELTQDDLSFYNVKGEFVAEPGEFKIFVGTSSSNVKEVSFELL